MKSVEEVAVDRLVIDNDGYAVPPAATKLKPQIVFKRNDGWTLGAPLVFAHAAYTLWKDSWVAYTTGEGWIDINQY